MNIKPLFLALLFAMPMAEMQAQAPQSEKTLDQWSQALKERITINGFAQASYTATNIDGDKQNGLEMKRILLWARAQITDRWSMLFMHDLGSKVQELYTDYRITQGKGMTIRFGQFKNQLSIENPLPPTTLELVDICSQAGTYLAGGGSDPLFGINYGRDLGIQLSGELAHGQLLYYLQLMNGAGVDQRDRDNRKDVIAKLEYRPVQGLRLVASAQKGYGTSLVAHSVYMPEENQLAVGETYRRDRWTAGFEYKTGANDYWQHRSASVRGEVMGGRDGKTNSWGGYLTTSIPLAGGWDVVASYDYFNYAKGYDRDRTQLVAGLQYWFYRTCRVMAQYTWADTWTAGLNNAWLEKPCHRLQVQTQIFF